MESILAKLLLAWTFLVHLIKWPFVRGKGGLKQFHENYGADGLHPLSSEERSGLFKFSECLNCGLCDPACPALLRLPREKFPGPSQLLISLTRSPAALRYVELDFSACEGCEACQKVCPNQIPVKAALEWIQAKRAA